MVWLIGILCLAAPIPAAHGQDLTAERLFAPEQLIQIEIVLPDHDWRELCRQTRDIRTAFTNSDSPFTYFRGDVTIDGVKVRSVGIRKKGFIGSLDDRCPSLKVKLDEYVDHKPIKGLDVLTLNNNKQDPSLVSQFLTYRLFNAAGVHAPRSNFARVTVNGEYLGIYSNVETIGKQFLKQRFGNSSGNLYEGTLTDFYPATVGKLEAKGNDKQADRGKLMRLAKLLAAKDELVLDEIERLVDVDYFIKFWAVESLIGFWDGYSNNQNNYWVYEHRGNGKFYFMPWGADGAFLGMGGPFGFVSGGTAVYAEAMLANRLYHTRGVPDRYRQTMLRLLDTVWRENELLATIDRIEALVKGHLHERQAGTSRGMNSVRRFIRSRRATLAKDLEMWPAAIAATPRKPMYTVEVGSATGSFATQWQGKPAAGAGELGGAELRLELDGASVRLKQLAVRAEPAQLPTFPFGFGGPPPGPGDAPRGQPVERAASGTAKPADAAPAPPAGTPPAGGPGRAPGGGPFGQFEPPATIVFTGVQESDAKKLTLTLSIDRKDFAAGLDKSVPVFGTLAEGAGGPGLFNPFGGRSLTGTVQLTSAGMRPGDRVVGKFDAKVVETHGGFMDMAARRPAGPPGGPGGAGPGTPPREPDGFPFGPGGPAGMMASPVSLAGMREVQKELDVTDSQRKQLDELQRTLQEQMRAAFSTINFEEIFNLGEDERLEQFDAVRRKTEQANRAAEQRLDQILGAAQRDRLNQLRLQREGAEAFQRPEVVKRLGLTREQQQKIGAIQKAARPQVGFGPPDFGQWEERRRKALADAIGVLSDSQKADWTALTGGEFKFPLPMPALPFGPPPGSGGG
jgi:spore coat protein CotH